MVHIKCRNKNYIFSTISRLLISDEQVPWSIPLENYNPPDYTSPSILNKPWADPDLSDLKFKPKWNNLDRKSHTGNYQVLNGRPLNPFGRTGLAGRGVLGKWGPNHAADPIVTRWKNFENRKQLHDITKLPILQFCAIQRKDCDEWAIPGGMVDPGEQITQTLLREFLEEAFNTLESNPENREKTAKIVSDFFKNGLEIYKGYVDDPRNTDNAWMETVAVNFHDDLGDLVGKFKLEAGDDAKNICWMDIDSQLNLYASHSSLIEKVAQVRGAHW